MVVNEIQGSLSVRFSRIWHIARLDKDLSCGSLSIDYGRTFDIKGLVGPLIVCSKGTEDEAESGVDRRSSSTAFLSSRRKIKKKKAKKPRSHHGFVRRREWKLSDEYKAQEESRRALELDSSCSVAEVDDDLGQSVVSSSKDV